MPRFRKLWLSTATLTGLHTILFVLISVLIFLSSDGEAAMAYGLFNFIDWPSSYFFPLWWRSDNEIIEPILLLGTMQWAAIGFGVGLFLVLTGRPHGK